MKRIIYFVLAILVCGIYAGCSESEIELYNQTSRINFYGSGTVRKALEPYGCAVYRCKVVDL